MPKMDGFELAEKIRDINPDVPLIFLTAKTLSEDVEQGFKLGADDYLQETIQHRWCLTMRIDAVLPYRERSPRQSLSIRSVTTPSTLRGRYLPIVTKTLRS